MTNVHTCKSCCAVGLETEDSVVLQAPTDVQLEVHTEHLQMDQPRSIEFWECLQAHETLRLPGQTEHINKGLDIPVAIGWMTQRRQAAHIPDGQVDEDPHKMDDAADKALQLADNRPGVLEGECKVLAVLVDLEDCVPHVMQGHLPISIHVEG